MQVGFAPCSGRLQDPIPCLPLSLLLQGEAAEHTVPGKLAELCLHFTNALEFVYSRPRSTFTLQVRSSRKDSKRRCLFLKKGPCQDSAAQGKARYAQYFCVRPNR